MAVSESLTVYVVVDKDNFPHEAWSQLHSAEGCVLAKNKMYPTMAPFRVVAMVPASEVEKAADALQSVAHRADDLFLKLHGDASPDAQTVAREIFETTLHHATDPEDMAEISRIASLLDAYGEAEWKRRINTPLATEFLTAVANEAAHQRARWGLDADNAKTPGDWFWLIGFLVGKALHDIRGKRQHHLVAAGAALLNWLEAEQRVPHCTCGTPLRRLGDGDAQWARRIYEWHCSGCGYWTTRGLEAARREKGRRNG